MCTSSNNRNFFDEVFEKYFYNPVCIALALIIFGIAFIVIENYNKKRNKKQLKEDKMQITYKDAIIIGVFQVEKIMILYKKYFLHMYFNPQKLGNFIMYFNRSVCYYV